MDHLSAMLVFTHVVDAGSFSKASQKLNMPLPSVSRKVAELEDHLGAQLLTRTTRKLSLTESGARYLDAARRILSDVQEAERQASNEYVEPVGSLTITAPSAFGTLHVLPIVREFLQAYPDVNIRLLLADQVLHLLEEHIDLGVRIGPLSDSSMKAKALGQVQRIHCASPQYLAEKGVPETPDDLLNHDIISFSNIEAHQEWVFPVGRKAQPFPIKPRLIVNSAAAAVDSALHHGGITRLLSYQAARHIAAKELTPVLTQYDLPINPVNFIYPQGRLVPLKLRTFIDFAAPRLSDRLNTIEQQCSPNRLS